MHIDASDLVHVIEIIKCFSRKLLKLYFDIVVSDIQRFHAVPAKPTPRLHGMAGSTFSSFIF